MPKLGPAIAICYLVRACLAGGPVSSVLAPRFEENAGQSSGDVRFLVRAPGYAAAFEREGAVLYAAPPGSPDSGVIQMRLLGAAPRPTLGGEGDPVASTMLYRGSLGSLGSRLRNYEVLRYQDVYPGIDWLWHFQEGALEFQFELDPGTDPASIRMAFTGASGVRLDRDGNLDVDGSIGLHYRRPNAWQNGPGGRAAVPIAFRIDSGVVTFDVGHYDSRLPLTIDPVVKYSRYLGGAGYDAAYAVATDAAGDVYVTGETSSVDFTSSSGVRYNRDAFVSKLSPDGTQIVYSVLLSSGGNDAGKAIAIDGGGNIWVAGVAGGSGFPTTSGALSSHSSGAAFVARLDTNGLLKYATYLGGGSGTDVATALAIDSSGGVYVAGYTSSVDFPTTSGAPQTSYQGGTDAFLVKLSSSGGFLSYSTLLGGSGNDSFNALSVDAGGTACATGQTSSSNLPVRNAVQATYGGNGDALLACLNPTGTAWKTLTYLGGSGLDEALGIARDTTGNIYLTGDTYSYNFPTTSSAYRKVSAGGYDAFVVKLNSAGTAVAFATLLGGSGSDSGTSISVDAAGDVWTAGYTASVDFPVTGSPAFGGYFDGFLAEISADGSSLLWAGYLGGSGDDRCLGMTLAGTGDPIVVGMTGSANFPTTIGAVPAPYNAFVVQLAVNVAPTALSVTGSSSSGSTTFVATLSDGNGSSDIQTVYFLIDRSLSGVNACFLMYNRDTGGLYLMNDAGTAWLPYVAPGMPTTVSNSQCTLSASRSSVSGVGSTLSVQFSVSVQPTFSGIKSLYLAGFGTSGAGTGWQGFGTFSIGANVPPQVVSAIQESVVGGISTFAVTAQDGDGYSDIQTVYFLIDRALSGVNACFLMYSRSTNSLYLMNDAGTAWLPPVSPGTSTTVSNSQCTLYATGSSITGSGNVMTVRFKVGYQSGFAGVKNLYLAAFDSNAGTGWQPMGTTTIGVNVSPQAVSVIPTTLGANRGALTVTTQDGNGYLDIQIVYFLIDRSLSGVNACFLMYNRGTNGLYLMNDAGSAWLPALVPGSAGTVSNAQCTLNAAASSVSGNGTTLSVVFDLQFQPGFAGSKSLYLAAFDFSKAGTGWQASGSWIVP